jgi:kumamolisin
MQRLILAFYLCMALPLLVKAQSGVQSGTTAHPHHHGSQAAPLMIPGTLPPYETAASLACQYKLAPVFVPGCPVLTTSSLPTGGSGVIAIVNAFDYPSVIADLNVFNDRFGLPECNASNPCVQRVFATGKRPTIDGLWAQNAALIVQYVHAWAPQAQIVLVEAQSSLTADLWVAVKKANQILANHGGGQMILPFGDFEGSEELVLDNLFTEPGVVYLSGNEGSLGFFDYPGASPNVICLSGTGLVRDKTTGIVVGELASSFWTGGQSVYESRPSYQDGVQDKVGTQRGIPDLTFASDPITGAVLYYSSVPFDGIVGWIFEGDVAVGEAGWAAIINRAGSHAVTSQDELALLYSELGNTDVLRDITRGKGIGKSARPGWDFMTGVGVPVGVTGK